MTTVTQELDARGLNCPLPILRTKKSMAAMARGEVLRVTATDPGSVKDLEAFCKQTGNTLLESQSSANEFVFLIQKG